MRTISIPATFMRGGTSKALMIKAEDLPSDKAEWPALLCSMMGSPDPYGRQLDGMGGGISSVSKVCVIAQSSHPEADVDYTFVQVQVKDASIDMSGNCGNMLSAVGPFAVDEGIVSGSGDKAVIRIHNTNTGKVIHATFALVDGKPLYTGNLEIPGVGGKGSPINLEFLSPAGATTGHFLPTGSIKDTLTLADGSDIEASLFDAGNACAMIRASDVGLSATERPADLDKMPDVLQRLDEIRVAASIKMGIAKDEQEARTKRHVPFIAFLAPPSDFVATSGLAYKADDMDFTVRVISSGQPHLALPVTATLCLTIASKYPGSIVHEVANPAAGEVVRLGMPSGILTASAKFSGNGEAKLPVSGSFFRTARRLFKGEVFADLA